jgi:hypothetical protein
MSTLVSYQSTINATDLDKIGELTANDYWFLEGRGWLSDVSEQQGYIYVTVWRPPIGISRNRIRKNLLDDRQSKSEGYQYAVANIITNAMSVTTLSLTEISELSERLHNLTGLSFRRREEWINWFKKNKHRLRLTKNGDRLEVQP